MKPFGYARASSVAEAVQLGSGPDAVYLGGGTNLVDHLRLGIRSAGMLVDITRLPLDTIEPLGDGGVRVGALVRNTDLAANRFVREHCPFVSQAVLAGASGQLRNMATTGGNLLQRTRCAYFTDASLPCNKRQPGSGCGAMDGFGRYNAVIGTSSSCVATNPSDLCVPLAALDAVVVVASSSGTRRIPFADFHRRPGDTPETDTSLAAGELITAVEIPSVPFAVRSTYRKVRDRASYAFALVSVAAALDVAEGQVRDVRLAFGGIGTVPHRAHTAEAALRGGPATGEAFRAAVEVELAAATPGRDNAFKIPMCIGAAESVLTELAGRVDRTEEDR